MFDVGFWEMILIGLVSLLVFGPEQLPKVVREVSFWLRKARSVVANVKAEVDQELRLEEMRQTLREKKRSLEDAAKVLSSPGIIGGPADEGRTPVRPVGIGESDRAEG